MPESNTKEITVHFVPQWPGNPYHSDLARSLRDNHVFVDDEDCLKTIMYNIHRFGKMPEIVHVHAIPRFSLSLMPAMRFFFFWIRLIRLRVYGVRLVWTIHDITHHESVYPWFEQIFCRAFFNYSDSVIVHSEAALKSLERQWKVKSDNRLSVIPHGNYIGRYSNHGNRTIGRDKIGTSHSRFVILFLGNIRPYKGVEELIKAFKKVQIDDSELIIAGKPLSKEISDRIHIAIKNHNQIHFFPGRVADDEMQDYFNAADVVVFPYTKALTSGALILAMSFGRACIVPRIGALEDALDVGGGFFYDPQDLYGLDKALLSASRERSDLESMGSLNHRKACASSWSDSAFNTAQVYRNCLKC